MSGGGRLRGDPGLGHPLVLAQGHALTGHTRSPNDPASLLLSNRGLGVIHGIDRDKSVGTGNATGINDVLSESAVIVPRRTIPTRPFDQRARLEAIRSTCPSRGAFEQEAHGHEIHRGGGE